MQWRIMSAPLLAIVLLALLASGSAHDHDNHNHDSHDKVDEEATTLPPQQLPEIQCSSGVVCESQWGPNADCFGGRCECKDGSEFYADEAKCIEPITSFRSSQTCTSDRECRINESKCRQGKCQCEDKFIESIDKSKCLPLMDRIGGGCEEDMQCSTLNRNTECKDYQCVCRPGTKLNQLGACIESKDLDAKCNGNDMCTTPNSICYQNTCVCKEGFVVAADNKRCLEVADGFKSRCEESIQCTVAFGDLAECLRSECICKTRTHFSDMKCWEDKGLGDRCDRPDECYIAADGNNQRLHCIAGSCTCKPEYKPDLSTRRCNSAASLIMMPGLLAVLIAAVRFA
ncbi:fibulin-2-like [Cloeon dipterum]|uniref:fibulin-2-like n=1 Tax=Cloeon dipterum TaxID=197152 RepID=UPI00321FAB64